LLTVAHNIESLKNNHPQLKGFLATNHTNLENLEISYAYHTHKAKHRGGWTSGVPHPDDDGVWFHLDFHDPDSKAQIHTLPLQGTIWAALKQNGAKPCE